MIFSCLPSTASGTIYEKYDLTSTLPFLQFVYIYIYIKKTCIYCYEIIIKCKVKEKYTIPFLYTTRKKEEKKGNIEISKKER